MFTISNKPKGENINAHSVNQIQSILFLYQLIIKNWSRSVNHKHQMIPLSKEIQVYGSKEKRAFF